jgi:hypothetical protein
VAVPADIDDSRLEKASGVVELPQRVSWSGPPIQWDLADRRQRAGVYEIVLSEGTDDDVRRFIEVDQLLDLWDDPLAGAARPPGLGGPRRGSPQRPPARAA